jgi:adenine phosphoribosyltransferase
LIRAGGGMISQALFIVDLPDLKGSEKLRAAGVESRSLLTFPGD